MTQYLFIIVTFFFIGLTLLWIYKIYKTDLFFKYNRSINVGNVQNERNVSIIIPVLDEVSRIEETIYNMLEVIKNRNNSYLVLVSTEKEFEIFREKSELIESKLTECQSYNQIEDVLLNYNMEYLLSDKGIEVNNLNNIKDYLKSQIRKRENTIELISRIAKKNKRVEIFHYPHVDGYMAHQVNHGVISFVKKYPELKNYITFALYNADSKIVPETLSWIDRVNQEDVQVVFQQYGNYTKNLSEILEDNALSKFILVASSLWQVRWSMGFEIPNALRQFKKVDRNYSFNKRIRNNLNYCIGHGLFFDYMTFNQFGGFSEITSNEDAIWGLQASYYDIPIVPIPFLDLSESPTSVESLYKQKTTWYYGPMNAFQYRKIIRKFGSVSSKYDEKNLFILTLALFEHSVRWIFIPTMIVVYLFLLSESVDKLIVSIIVCLLYLNVPNFYAFMVSNKYEENVHKLTMLQTILTSLFSFFQFALHGISGYRAIFRAIIAAISKKKIHKERTIMKGMI